MKKNIFLIILFIITIDYGYSQIDCTGPQEGEVFHIKGTNDYCAAIKSDCFNFYHANQEWDNLCWAACIQMVLHYQGLYISQKEIVIKAYGSFVNRPADCGTTTKAANNWNYHGITIKAWQEYSKSPSKFIDALAHKYPIIVGLNNPGRNVGHAYVLTAIYYRYGIDNSYIPFRVVLRDPWGPNPDKYETSWSDFLNRLNCVVHVTY